MRPDIAAGSTTIDLDRSKLPIDREIVVAHQVDENVVRLASTHDSVTNASPAKITPPPSSGVGQLMTLFPDSMLLAAVDLIVEFEDVEVPLRPQVEHPHYFHSA